MLLDRVARDVARHEAQLRRLGAQLLTDEQLRELFHRIRARHEAAVLNCTHAYLDDVRVPGDCDTCAYYGPLYLMRNCGCGLEVCRWCSCVILENGGVFFALRGLRREFFSRGYIRSLPPDERLRLWRRTKRQRYDLRLARLQALQRGVAPEAFVRANMSGEAADRVRREHRERRARQLQILRQMGVDTAAWEARYGGA